MPTDRPGLSTSVLVFMVYKAFGVLWDLGFVVFMFRWALPAFERIPGAAEYTSGLLTTLVFPLVDVVATAVGVRLIFMRARRVRLYWLVYLAFYSVVLLVQIVLGVEDQSAVLFLIGALAWLAYWAFARTPRQLALTPHWHTPIE